MISIDCRILFGFHPHEEHMLHTKKVGLAENLQATLPRKKRKMHGLKNLPSVN